VAAKVMFLVDTNVWLERLLDQASSRDVGSFLEKYPSDQLIITDFSFHSIGVILNRLRKEKLFLDFTDDILVRGGVMIGSIGAEEMKSVVAAIKKYKLDFDDAYQYCVAEKLDAIIVSFDKDLDRTRLGRKKPADIL
jgi:predicted nucleic acid-binding protein